MDNIIGIITEILVIIFNILIYMKVTVLKNNNLKTKMVMYGGSAAITVVFFLCTFLWKLPEAFSSFVCVTLPSFFLFFILSKFKDFRFFVTFCLLDTITLIITFFSRAADILFGHIAGLIVSVIVVLAMAVFYAKGKPFFKSYRNLLKNVNDGWGSMAVATLLIYFLLVFSASYPVALIHRPEYLISYGAMSVTLLAVYAVFIFSLVQRKKLSDLNEQLVNEKKWHKIAYIDALTGIKNRMAYIEKINELERGKNSESSLYAVMIDVDDFKRINDTRGHHFGDVVLRNVAEYLQKVFPSENCTVFRIGGDEFAVIISGLNDEEVEEKINIIINDTDEEIGCTLSIGFSKVNFENNTAVEIAFEKADRRMYKHKISKSK